MTTTPSKAYPSPVLPPHLREGDLIAVVSPSSGTAGIYDDRLRRSILTLETMGFAAKVMPNATKTGRWSSSSIDDRVSDLENAFADSEVSAVLCAIGGRGASQLLETLNFEIIAANPKIFCGYSDVTALHSGINARTGLVTFYGPSLMAEFGEYPSVFPETKEAFLAATTQPKPLGDIPSFSRIFLEGSDWSSRVIRKSVATPSVQILRDGRGSGPLKGGCLPVLCEMEGTPWRMSFEGCVLVLETPEPPYDMNAALADLWHLRNAGQLARLEGLVIGWPFSSDQINDLTECVAMATRGYNYPITIGLPAGHTAPMVTLPLGVIATLDGSNLHVEESAVSGK